MGHASTITCVKRHQCLPAGDVFPVEQIVHIEADTQIHSGGANITRCIRQELWSVSIVTQIAASARLKVD